MHELIVERSFSAAHALRDYDGPCARLHGHNYRVELGVVGDDLDPNGMLLDFGELMDICDRILGEMDHQCLNELPAFADQNPTSENIARHIYDNVRSALAGTHVTVSYVRVWETAGQSATYREGQCAP